MLLSYVAVVILSEAQNLYISLLPLLLLLLLPLPLPLFPTAFQHRTPPPETRKRSVSTLRNQPRQKRLHSAEGLPLRSCSCRRFLPSNPHTKKRDDPQAVPLSSKKLTAPNAPVPPHPEPPKAPQPPVPLSPKLPLPPQPIHKKLPSAPAKPKHAPHPPSHAA